MLFEVVKIYIKVFFDFLILSYLICKPNLAKVFLWMIANLATSKHLLLKKKPALHIQNLYDGTQLSIVYCQKF
jgi:hypothetical protein